MRYPFKPYTLTLLVFYERGTPVNPTRQRLDAVWGSVQALHGYLAHKKQPLNQPLKAVKCDGARQVGSTVGLGASYGEHGVVGCVSEGGVGGRERQKVTSTRPHAVGCIGRGDQEQGGIESRARGWTDH